MALEPLPFAYAQGSPCFFDADYAKRLSSRNSSKTFLDEPSQHSWSASTSEASKARNRTVLHVSSNKFSKTFRTRRSLEDVLLSESSSILVSRKRDKQIDMRCCLSEASSWTSQAAKPSASNDYDNRTSGLRAQRSASRRVTLATEGTQERFRTFLFDSFSFGDERKRIPLHYSCPFWELYTFCRQKENELN